jgi:hypothetical protein
MAYTNINKSKEHFDTSTWTATTSAISNLDFSPDWVWIKSTDSGNGHILFDTIRGANKRLSSAVTSEEFTVTDELMSFDSNGYTLGSSGNTNDTNPFNASYVGWSWRGSDSSAVSNTDGDITSTVSANTTSGFSIVSYTGSATNPSTVGHGLGTAPAMIIVKNRSTAGRDWVIWHKELGGSSSTADLLLFTTDAKITSSGYWGSSAPSSTTFGVGNTNNNNASGDDFIAYCFAEKKGFSKFGSYNGAGSNLPFIYTGFKPAFLIIKRTDSLGQWNMFDIARADVPNANGNDQVIYSNSSDAELSSATREIDLLSNGFKCRATGGDINASGGSYIYMAFAEAPLVGSNNVPCTAR